MPEPSASATSKTVSSPSLDPPEESSDRVIPRNPDLTIAQLRFRVDAPHDNPKRAEHLKELLGLIKDNAMGPYYELVAAESSSVKLDGALLAELKATNAARLAVLNAAIAEAEKQEGDTEVRDALQAKADYLSSIGAKEEALSALRATYDKSVGKGMRIDNVFHQIRIGLFFTDRDLITASLTKAKQLMEAGGDWDRKNRLKVYEALYLASVREFTAAAPLFLEAVPTFTATELLTYKELVFYTVTVCLLALERSDLRKKVIESSEVTEQLYGEEQLKRLLSSFYEADYADFFVSLAWLEQQLKENRYLNPSYRWYTTKMRTKAYTQLLSSYSALSLNSMAKEFGVTREWLEAELYRLIVNGSLHARIDAVSGIVKTTRLDTKNFEFKELLTKSDVVLNAVQKLSRVVNH